MLLYTAGIHHPSIVSIQSIMRHHDTTLDTDNVCPLEQSKYICAIVWLVVHTIIIIMNTWLTINIP